MTDSFTAQQTNASLQHKNELTRDLFTHNTANNSNLVRLKAFIVHRGRSATCGHYVAYLRLPSATKGGRDAWFEFNDEKVFEVSCVPYADAYLYFFERID